MLIGVLIVLYPNTTKLHLGDLLILMATLIAPLGNYFQQKARQTVSSEMILFVRSSLSTPVVLILAHLFKERCSLTDLKSSAVFILINGLFFVRILKNLMGGGDPQDQRDKVKRVSQH
jgi:drug/metabolite transporter (DMT)-like permease